MHHIKHMSSLLSAACEDDAKLRCINFQPACGKHAASQRQTHTYTCTHVHTCLPIIVGFCATDDNRQGVIVVGDGSQWDVQLLR